MESQMTNPMFRPRRWIALALGAVSVASVISFARAANTVTFQPGGGIPLRGVPFNLRPVGNSFSLPGPIFFGGFPQPVQNMPITPVLPQGGVQGQTPGFNPGSQQGGQGIGGGISGGTSGISGGIGGGISGGIGGIGGGIGGIGGGISGIGGGISGGIGGIGGGIGGIGGGIGGIGG